jgi:hypothetical protein
MTVISPELALVDPSLRAEAVAGLPPLEPFDFLRFSRRPPALADFGFLADHEDSDQGSTWRPPLLLAASVYAVSSLARVVVMDGLFVLALAAAVVLLNAIG